MMCCMYFEKYSDWLVEIAFSPKYSMEKTALKKEWNIANEWSKKTYSPKQKGGLIIWVLIAMDLILGTKLLD